MWPETIPFTHIANLILLNFRDRGSLQNQSQYLQSSNHFQLHGSTGVRFYVKGTSTFGRRWIFTGFII